MPPSPRSRPRTPPVPALFQSKDADVVLLTGDRAPAELRVHRRILVEASAFFRTMFGLPQPVRALSGAGGDGQVEEEREDLPRVEMPEPASTLVPLLTLLYPVPPPHFPTLDSLPALLRAAHKYDLPSATAHLRALLLEPRFLTADPLAVYALACTYGLAPEARAASRQTLRVDLMALLLPLPGKLGDMRAVDLVQLVALRVARCAQAKALLRSPALLGGMRCTGCGAMPAWVAEWRRRACVEMDRYPVSDTVCGSAFLGEAMCASGAAGAGCAKCGVVGVWDRQAWEALREEIDALPDTI